MFESVSVRLSALQAEIEALLEGSEPMLSSQDNRNFAPADQNMDAESSDRFGVSSDFDQIEQLIETRISNGEAKGIDDLFFLFRGFFEAAFLFKGDSPAEVTSFFIARHSVRLKLSDRPKVDLRLPKDLFESERVMRQPAAMFFERLGMQVPLAFRSASAFAFSPLENVYVVLVCDRAPLWQPSAVQSAFELWLRFAVPFQAISKNSPNRRWLGLKGDAER